MRNFTNPNMNGDLARAFHEVKNKVEEAVELPEVTSSDDGDILSVNGGKWQKTTPVEQKIVKCNLDSSNAITFDSGYSKADLSGSNPILPIIRLLATTQSAGTTYTTTRYYYPSQISNQNSGGRVSITIRYITSVDNSYIEYSANMSGTFVTYNEATP